VPNWLTPTLITEQQARIEALEAEVVQLRPALNDPKAAA
jgi:hypothetical protein